MASILNNLTPKLQGLFNGAKLGQTFLPWNDLIQTYNLEKESLFRVRMSAYKQNLLQFKGINGKGTVDPSSAINDPDPMWESELLHNEDSFNVSHKHNYGDLGGIAGMINAPFANISPLGAVSTLRNITTFKDLINKKDARGSAVPFRTEWNDFQSFDIAKSYKGCASPQSFTVSFLLFVQNNPLMDIVLPSLIFAYLSYPTFSAEKSKTVLNDIAESISNIKKENKVEGIKSLAAEYGMSYSPGSDGDLFKPMTEEEANKKPMESIERGLKDSLTVIYDVISNNFKDNWRIRVGDPPPYWTVSSSNGIVFMHNAHISDVTITYHGPWLKSIIPSSNMGGFVNSVLGKAGRPSNSTGAFGPAGLSPNEVLGGAAKKGEVGVGYMLDEIDNLSGFPSYADIKITFTSNFSQIFADELLMGIAGANSQFGNNITTGFKSAIKTIGPS